jgi:hypothetical protein
VARAAALILALAASVAAAVAAGVTVGAAGFFELPEQPDAATAAARKKAASAGANLTSLWSARRRL